MRTISLSKKVDNDDLMKLQTAQFLTEASSNVINNILTIPYIQINSDKFSQLIDDYADKFVFFEMLKVEMGKIYLPPDKFISIEWAVDYNHGFMNIKVSINNDNDIDELKKLGYIINE